MSETDNQLSLEIGHVLFLDIVGYSKLLIEEQRERLNELTGIVLATPQVKASSDEQLVKLPTGDGMALVFRHSSEKPARCALEISEALRKHPELPVRMGIHSGPVSEVTDVSERTNIAGPGINVAQRVINCGDAGHILVSGRTAEDLGAYQQWQPLLHDLGDCEVKHGVRLRLYSLYDDRAGNAELPSKLKRVTSKRKTGITLFIIGLLLAIGGAILWRFIGAKPEVAKPVVTPPAMAKAQIDAKSVAVLPFDNLSDDKGSEYFSDGISEELLTVLQKIPGLRVAARTSAFSFKGKRATAQEIGEKLGVAHLVEGSVRRAGNMVRIAARLTNTSSGDETWSENYTRDLKDIFAVQTELAETIVGQLRAQLSRSSADSKSKEVIQAEVEAAEQGGTKNVEAHQNYLLGRFHLTRHSEKAAGEALQNFQRAVELDPNYALA